MALWQLVDFFGLLWGVAMGLLDYEEGDPAMGPTLGAMALLWGPPLPAMAMLFLTSYLLLWCYPDCYWKAILLWRSGRVAPPLKWSVKGIQINRPRGR